MLLTTPAVLLLLLLLLALLLLLLLIRLLAGLLLPLSPLLPRHVLQSWRLGASRLQLVDEVMLQMQAVIGCSAWLYEGLHNPAQRKHNSRPWECWGVQGLAAASCSGVRAVVRGPMSSSHPLGDVLPRFAQVSMLNTDQDINPSFGEGAQK